MRPISHSLVRCDQVVSCYLIMVVYHLHFLDRSKVFRYIGFAQQAYRELTQSKTASTGWRPVDVFENTFCLVVFFVLFCFVLFCFCCLILLCVFARSCSSYPTPSPALPNQCQHGCFFLLLILRTRTQVMWSQATRRRTCICNGSYWEIE